MRPQGNKCWIIVVFSILMLFQLSAQDMVSYIWNRVLQGREKPDVTFLHAVIGIGFGAKGQGLTFMVTNDGKQELWVEGLLDNSNTLCFDSQEKSIDIGIDSGPGKYYTIIPTETCAIEYKPFKTWSAFRKYAGQEPFTTVFWVFSPLNRKTDIGVDKVFLIKSQTKEPYDFTSRFDDPDAVNLKIAKVLDDDNGYNFAFIISNNTANDIEIDEFLGENTRIKIRFPDGKEFAFPRNAEAKKVTLAAGKSMYQFFDLKKVLEENPGWSLDNLKYGISQLTLEVLPDKGELRSFSLPLVKFNQEPPTDPSHGRYRSLIKTPTKEVFENNDFTLMEKHVM